MRGVPRESEIPTEETHTTGTLSSLSRCGHCGAASYPVKRYCPACGSANLVSEPLPGTAEVYSYKQIAGQGHDHLVALLNAGPVRVVAAVAPEHGPLVIGQLVRLTTRSAPPRLWAECV